MSEIFSSWVCKTAPPLCEYDTARPFMLQAGRVSILVETAVLLADAENLKRSLHKLVLLLDEP